MKPYEIITLIFVLIFIVVSILSDYNNQSEDTDLIVMDSISGIWSASVFSPSGSLLTQDLILEKKSNQLSGKFNQEKIMRVSVKKGKLEFKTLNQNNPAEILHWKAAYKNGKLKGELISGTLVYQWTATRK